MKIKTLLTILLVCFALSSTYASFPVKRTVNSTTEISTNVSEELAEATLTSPAATVAGKDKWVAAALWFVLGGFAAHRWYLGSPWYWNVLYIITFGYLLVGHVIDIVQILTDSYPGL